MTRRRQLPCIALFCVGALMLSTAAVAQPAIGPGASSGTDIDLSAFEVKTETEEGAVFRAFAVFDANADGKITRGEARANSSLSRQFHALDRNRDGNLSPEEFATR